MFPKVAFKILANAGALWAAGRYVSGFQVLPVEFFQFEAFPIAPAVQTLAAAAVALAIANAIAYPLLNVIAAVLPFITTAMLVVALNMALLYAGAAFLPAFAIAGLAPLFWSGLILGITNTLV